MNISKQKGKSMKRNEDIWKNMLKRKRKVAMWKNNEF